jgi:hypothetical protein
MNNSQIDNVKLGLLPNSTTNDGLTSVSPSSAKPNVVCRFFSRLWYCQILFSHKWTCNAEQGIPPTKEELTTGIKGFNSYAKMYCKRCNKISKLSL